MIRKRFSLLARALAFAALLSFAPGASAQFNAFKDPSDKGGGKGGSGDIAGFKAVTPTIQAGKVSVGATAFVVILFKNTGATQVKVGNVNLYPSSNVSASVTLNQCSEGSVSVDAQCAITVAVKGLTAGTWRVEALVDHDGPTRVATASMQGDVDAGSSGGKDAVRGALETSPTTLDFGTSPGGIALVRPVTLRNITVQPVKIDDISLDVPEKSGFSQKSQCAAELQAGESCSIIVNWQPTSKGLAQGVLTVHHSGMGGMVQIEVKGTLKPEEDKKNYAEAIPNRGLLAADKDKIDFGASIKGESAITITLVNNGGAALTFLGMTLSGIPNGLALSDDGCAPETVLQPGEACPLTITWDPLKPGPVLDSLQIMHSGSRGVLVIPVLGTADASVTVASPAVVSAPAPSSVKAAPAAVAAPKAADTGEVSDEKMFNTPSLKKMFRDYKVTSHSETRAVLNGPDGGQVVRDGEDVIINGVKCNVTVTPEGVMLSSGDDRITLDFDPTLRLMINKDESAGEDAAAGKTSKASTKPPSLGGAGGSAPLMPPNLLKSLIGQ